MKQVLALLLLTVHLSTAQQHTYDVSLEPIEITDLGGLQSYVVATHGDEWLVIGGRLDGLHQRQPFASFTTDGNNDHLLVINPISKAVWKADTKALSPRIREQLSSTNIQAHQRGDDLLLTGGYGYSPTMDDHITYPYLTILDVPSVIAAVKAQGLSDQLFVQIEDERFAVTGGRLNAIGDTCYLVGGHRFTGRYNPMGPTHGPGFEQAYTHEVRRFIVSDDSGSWRVDHLAPWHDEMHLRRRDYNLVPHLDRGQRSLVAYSGVFQVNADLPHLYPVLISADGHSAVDTFQQLYNHYHCPTLPIYHQATDEMHTLFFGGIAQFYLDGTTIVQDNDVPFVPTIADVHRTADGLAETVLPTTMPGYLGAGAELILAPTTPTLHGDIVDGDDIGDETVVGYIYGGIRSSADHIFWVNDGSQSTAAATIYRVLLTRRMTTATTSQPQNATSLLIYPNPAQAHIRLSIELEQPIDVKITVTDMQGRQVDQRWIPQADLSAGKNYVLLDKVNISYGAYIYRFELGHDTIVRKVIWTE